MTEYFRQRFYVHSALQSASCKRMTQGMKPAVNNILSFKQHQRNGVNLDSVDAMPYTEFDKLIEDIMSKYS